MEEQVVYGVGIYYEGIYKLFAKREDAEEWLEANEDYDFVEEMKVC